MRVTDVRGLHDVRVTDVRWLHDMRVTDVRWLHGVRVTDVGWLHDVRVTDVGWLHGVQVKHRQQHIKMLLESKKIPFEEVDISCSHDLLDKMREIAGNPKCLPPQILPEATSTWGRGEGVEGRGELDKTDAGGRRIECHRFYYTGTWAATRRLRRMCFHFWRMGAVVQGPLLWLKIFDLT